MALLVKERSSSVKNIILADKLKLRCKRSVKDILGIDNDVRDEYSHMIS